MKKTGSCPPYPPKDGGWGWFVVLGTGMITFLIGGLMRAFSIIYEEIRRHYNSSASTAAWVISLNVTMSLFSGPLSTMLSTKFSVRKVAAAGSLLMLVGYAASAFAPNLQWAYLAYAIAGLGQGFLYTPALVILSHWFDKRRGTATSIGLMNDGVGSLVMAPLLRYLLDHYGYSGTMLILSAIMANHFVVAALFREPDDLDYVSHQRDLDNDSDVCSAREANSHGDVLNKNGQAGVTLTTDTEAEATIIPCKNIVEGAEEVQERNFENELRMLECPRPTNGSLVTVTYSNDNNINDAMQSNLYEGNFGSQKLICKRADESSTKKMAAENEITVNLPDVVVHDAELEDSAKKAPKYFDYNLLKMGRYWTFSILMACGSLCASMCNTHIAGTAIECKLSPSQVAFLIGSMGVVNTTSKFLSGFLFDYSKLRNIRIHIFTFIGLIVSASLIVSPWIKQIGGFFAIWIIHMAALGAFVTQESLILADIVGRERFAGAIGVNRFFRGIGVLIGPTVGGFLKDFTGVYDYTFIFGGLCLFASLALFEISVIIFRRKSHNKT